jgi:hypothetical protein
MSGRFRASLGIVAFVVARVALAPVSVAGQARTTGANAKTTGATKTWAPLLTPDGQPDLQGVWLSDSATPLERPQALEGRQFLTDDEVTELQRRAARLFRKDGSADFAGGDNFFLAALANLEQYKAPNKTTGGAFEMVDRQFDNRTSLIVDPPDGKVPWTPEGEQRLAAAAAARLASATAGPEELTNDMRCLTFGVPRLGGNYGAGIYSYYQILQAPGYVVLMTEFIHETRIIPLDGRPHLPDSIRQWEGDSRGRWEGNTLIVDTTNFSPKSFFMGSAENLHLIERFTRVAPDKINYEMTVNDLTTWTKSWKAEIPLKQTQDRIYEVACHEGNSEVMHDILAGSRAADTAGEDAAKRPK